MKYVDQMLEPDETIRAWGQLHCIIYFWPTVMLLAGIMLATASEFSSALGALLFLCGIAMLLSAWIVRNTTEIAVTNKRVILKRGWIRRDTIEINANKIESVNVDQSILGRLCDFGTITVRGTGIGFEPLMRVAEPLSLRRAMNF